MRSVSVVIPTHNNLRLLGECLASLREQDYPQDALSTVVVDNGSTDGTAERVGARFPEVKIVRLETNSGFAAACNRGAADASGEYVAFLNDDAVAAQGWVSGLFAGLHAGGEGSVCVASHIRSRDGEEIEYSGASANLFGVGRPRSPWGWADVPAPPGEGDPVLFASGGAMLIHRRAFLDAGGFDPQFFAYFEDVDLGWRLWLLGHKVVYAPSAVVRHIGGATGSRSAAYRRYTLWECNALATIFKNYEWGNMERILSAALLLLYKRATLSAGEAFAPAEYKLTAPPDTNAANVERLPKVSVAHLAAIDRFNTLLPYFMKERRRIQERRVRADAEILPLLGRLWEPQFAGEEYASAARSLANALRLLDITGPAVPRRVLIIAPDSEQPGAMAFAKRLAEQASVALALLAPENAQREYSSLDRIVVHRMAASDPALNGLKQQADEVYLYPQVEGT